MPAISDSHALHIAQASKGKKTRGRSASELANDKADAQVYQPINYVNKERPGPQLVVIPGEIKSMGVGIEQKLTPNNIADFAELELGQANFAVLERSDMGPLLNELSLAVNMGDASSMENFKKGKFKTTRWFMKFDILKVEQVATAKKGFKGGALGNVIGAIGGAGAAVGGAAVRSVETVDEAGVWIIGMRYKILDATTTEQVATGYKELKMELGGQSQSVLGVERGTTTTVGLDTMAHRLVQECVAEVDANNK